MRIALSSTHGCGKTSILNKLKEAYPSFHYVTEVARDCKYPLNEKTSYSTQDFILREQIRRELEKPINEIIISDRSTYDNLAYAWYARDEGNISEEKFDELKRYATTWGMLYDHIFYIPIEFEMEKDGVRSENEDYRKNIDERVKELLWYYKDEDNRTTLHGTVEERLETVKNVIFRMADERGELLK